MCEEVIATNSASCTEPSDWRTFKEREGYQFLNTPCIQIFIGFIGIQNVDYWAWRASTFSIEIHWRTLVCSIMHTIIINLYCKDVACSLSCNVVYASVLALLSSKIQWPQLNEWMNAGFQWVLRKMTYVHVVAVEWVRRQQLDKLGIPSLVVLMLHSQTAEMNYRQLRASRTNSFLKADVDWI